MYVLMYVIYQNVMAYIVGVGYKSQGESLRSSNKTIVPAPRYGHIFKRNTPKSSRHKRCKDASTPLSL